MNSKVYIGNISKFQRVYKKKREDKFYIKTLTPYKDENYLIETMHWTKEQESTTYSYSYTTNKLTLPVFPCSIDTEGSYGVTYYTNTEGMNFTRKWNFYKQEGILLHYLYTENPI